MLKLIIVEGIPGSGKSSTARFLAMQSERNGNTTQLFHETTYQHPILIEDTISTPTAWMKQYLLNWDRFLEEQRDKKTTLVMESVLFQAPILHLLHMDLDKEAIIRFIENICARFTDLEFHLVYLYQDDPMIGINRMINTRGGMKRLNEKFEEFKHEPYYVNRGLTNPESHLDFLSEYAQIAKTANSRCSSWSLSIENTNWDWRSYYHTIVDHFGWSFIPDPIVPYSELVNYVGVYHNEELNLHINVELKDGQLFGFGDRQLKPNDLRTFYLDYVSMKIQFNWGPSGQCCGMIVKEKDLFGNRRDEGTKFIKIS
ncbi:thymidylate kinase [Paenibacillus sp. BK033]|uniref:hypothetical protein n=1 Tax=Paenibacillus sp. BK033 TaxID=2512133 RepID=UPI0010493101|nr:hypothetical protein [Paenibacillus sp. BK033]TCM96589.1 thymidylate kinase [Paenibacillus sp. BK033]